MKKFDDFMAALRAAEERSKADDELLRLFEKHYGDIKAHWDTCLPDKSLTSKPQIFHGSNFHKGFRQRDITGADDRTIYDLLSGVQPLREFWSIHRSLYG